MNSAVLQVLGLPSGQWPPDHYALLRLAPEAVSSASVEAAVQAQMARVRSLQLTYPEDVTDAMNRLAQALITLTDPIARSAYDEAIVARRPPIADENAAGSVEKLTDAVPDAVPQIDENGSEPIVFAAESPADPWLPRTSFAWRQPGDPDYYEVLPEHGRTLPPPLPATASGPPPLPVRAPTDLERRQPNEWIGAALSTPSSPLQHTQADATRARIRALKQARDALTDWDQVGEWLSVADRPLASRAEGVAVLAALRRLAAAGDVPASEFGRDVLELARAQPSIAALGELTPARREVLAAAWRRGRQALRGDYGKRRQRVGRHHGRHQLRRAVLRVRRWLPEVILLVAGTLALVMALYRSFHG